MKIAVLLTTIAGCLLLASATVLYASPSPTSQPTREIFIGGHIKNSGVYTGYGDITVLKLISLAGGKDVATDCKVEIDHRIDGDSLVKTTMFNSLLALQKRPSADMHLVDGDRVFLFLVEPASVKSGPKPATMK